MSRARREVCRRGEAFGGCRIRGRNETLPYRCLDNSAACRRGVQCAFHESRNRTLGVKNNAHRITDGVREISWSREISIRLPRGDLLGSDNATLTAACEGSIVRASEITLTDIKSDICAHERARGFCR